MNINHRKATTSLQSHPPGYIDLERHDAEDRQNKSKHVANLYPPPKSHEFVDVIDWLGAVFAADWSF